MPFADRLNQTAADAKKWRCDPKASRGSTKVKPFNEQDVSIAMSHAISATFVVQGITHMQFAMAVASKTHTVKTFQYHEQWAKMV
jgi:hypothetical protein